MLLYTRNCSLIGDVVGDFGMNFWQKMESSFCEKSLSLRKSQPDALVHIFRKSARMHAICTQCAFSGVLGCFL